MADTNFVLCIIAAMERLWFHQIVLFSESEEATTSLAPKTFQSFDSILSLPPLPDDEDTSPHESPSPEKQVLSQSVSLLTLQGDPVSNKEEEKKERPTRLMNIAGNRVRSHSSSPSTQKHSRKLRKQSKRRLLLKSMSCKTLKELELEEVKGFMDLGFVFNEENISPRTRSVVPGLQRLGRRSQIIDGDTHIIEGAEEEKKQVMRPYLSESWLIKRPDSPLLNLKISNLRSVADMKKHLRFWAKTVASEIHQ